MSKTVHRARATNIATIGTASAHGLSIGDNVNVAGLGGTGYNGNWVVVSVPDSTHFTYSNPGDDEAETSDTDGIVYGLGSECVSEKIVAIGARTSKASGLPSVKRISSKSVKTSDGE